MTSCDIITAEIQEIAGEAFGWFERRGRDGGAPFVTRKEGAPYWIGYLLGHAHGDFTPDDWRYETIWCALGAICDASDNDDASNVADEFADGNVDAYTSNRLAWLASNLNRVAYCDEASSEFGPVDGIVGMIGLGQYEESREVFYLVLEFLAGRIEEARS